jgi:hypothetical protein
MKPNFALSLSFEGIILLHRAAGGWREVGEVSVAADDLAGELAVLRKTASSLEPGGVRSKLIIPEGQIKYLTINTPGLSEAARRKAAETALHDATPYEISELAYDISPDGPKTHIAAVARETLSEAEAFATEHRFHPVSFVATPGDAGYLGEPFFGPTQGAADLLETNETVEADGIAVVIVGAIAPEAAAPTEPAKEIPTKVAIESETVAAETADTSPKLPQEDVASKEPVSTTAAASTTDKVKDEHKAEVEATHTIETPKPSQSELPLASSTPEPAVKDDAPAGVNSVGPAAPAPAKEAAKEEPEPKEPSVSTADPEQEIEPGKAKALAAAAAVGAPTKPTFSTAVRVPASPQGGTPRPATSFSSRRGGTAAATGKPLGGAQRGEVKTPTPDSSSLTQPAPIADTPVAPPAKAGFLSRRKPRKGVATPVPTPTAAATGTEAERMTVFGARADQVGGKPRFLGLIMTVILLVFLAGVAAWAAVFLDEGIAGLMKRSESRTTASAPENQIDPEIIRTPEGIAKSDAVSNEGVQIAALDPVLSAEDTAVLDALQNPRPEPEIPVISEQEAAARYAVTGIWPLAPPTTLLQPQTQSDPVYRSSIDAISNANDAIALPQIQELDNDIQLAAALSPPPFGQRTVLGAGGLIVPTATGIVTPGGYTLFAASPPLKPPATRARFVTQPGVTAPAVTPVAAPSPLLDFRPKNRPLGLTERSERAQLGGVSRIELAAYRPSLRPRSLQDRAKQAEDDAKKAEEARVKTEEERATAAATAAAAAALAIPVPAPSAIQDATRYAVAKSVRPDTRPRNFDRIVKRADRAPPQETRVAAAASVAPRTVAPKLPSKASVARSATVKNAINLRKVNLIGVYGKPSSRRALVRLSNGRYKKVSVGDRIDGGRVSAINNSELRYSKGGRNVILKMP